MGAAVKMKAFVRLMCLFWFCSFNASATAGVTSEKQTLVHDGLTRSYLVHVPQNVAQHGGLVPLVLVLHGGGGNGENAERMTGFSQEADEEGFIVVYPEGTGRFGKMLTWNAGHCCGYAMKNRIDDVSFIDALIDKLTRDYPVDPRRIYVTGMSNGGLMAHRLGVELSSRFAAIAPVVASVFGDETAPSQPVSALMINGLLDKHIPVEGGVSGGIFPDAWDGTPMKPFEAQGAFWARADGCMSAPEREDRKTYSLTRYRCPEGKNVELYLIKDNGHAWPGGQQGSRMGDKPSTALNATDVIWSFFKVHTRAQERRSTHG